MVTAAPTPDLARLPGVDPSWSRTVVVPDAEGVPRTWHLLDNRVAHPVGTLLCVHGNPTWSYLWRRMLATAPPGWRVVAPDHLGMGYSERLDTPRARKQLESWSKGQGLSNLKGTATAALERLR